MKLEGERRLPAPREKAWKMLMDPEVLTRCLPGCEKLEPAGENTYKASLKIGLPGAKGAYTGTVSLLDLDPPNSFKMTLEGKGLPGFVRGSATITLAEDGDSTNLRYSGDVQIGGLIASIGQRMIQGTASTLLNQVFESLERELRT